MTIQEFAEGMETIAGRLLKPCPTAKQIDAIFPKVSKFDAEIFAKAVENMSMGEYMPRLRELYEHYNIAKSQVRKANPDYNGCKYCENGKVFYEKQYPERESNAWYSYIGWCGHCYPPIKKAGMVKMYSDREYPNIRILTKPIDIKGDMGDKAVMGMARKIFGKADPGNEAVRVKSLAKEAENEEIPF